MNLIFWNRAPANAFIYTTSLPF
ncbi:hypothetical protein N7445_004511 [Penicillium cf. griseofulvum]|nr:hypothetical protein N7445_004511 [Penicillium cf. griseofulvum]